MCLIGDFVLTSNEGLKLQATGCLLERGWEGWGRVFNYKRKPVKYTTAKLIVTLFFFLFSFKCVPWIVLAIL